MLELNPSSVSCNAQTELVGTLVLVCVSIFCLNYPLSG